MWNLKLFNVMYHKSRQVERVNWCSTTAYFLPEKQAEGMQKVREVQTWPTLKGYIVALQ